MTITLDLDDIQGSILRGYRLPATAYVFVRFHDPLAGRTWIKELIPTVTSARPGRPSPRGPSTSASPPPAWRRWASASL